MGRAVYTDKVKVIFGNCRLHFMKLAGYYQVASAYLIGLL